VNNKNRLSHDKISKIFSDSVGLTQTLQSGIYTALLKHKQAGNAVCEWKNEQVVWISPEKILEKSDEQIDES